MNHPAGKPHAEPLNHSPFLLHQQLLECLEQERQALISADEAAILRLAAAKSSLLEQLQQLDQNHPGEAEGTATAAGLMDLKRRIAAAHRRNHALIGASLEVIQEFLTLLQPPGAATYGPPGRSSGSPGAALFHRQA